jgi:GNAT superfamily N-acetyltransferase
MNVSYKTDLPDTEQYFLLFESTGWNKEYHLSQEELYSTLVKSYYCVSAYQSGKLVGFGRILSDGVLHAMIYEMMVLPGYQGKGIGSVIMKMLIRKCQENNIRDIQLFCAQGKRKFYEKYGFGARPEDAPGMDFKT